MTSKVYKTVNRQNEPVDEKECESITFYGSNRPIMLHYNADFTRQYFTYRNTRYYLDEFMVVKNNPWSPNPPEYLKEFDAYLTDSFFSGIAIKYDAEEEAVKAFLFIS